MARLLTETLDSVARDYVGDGKPLNHYFVTDLGHVVTVTDSFELAYRHWRELASRSPRQECALEDRSTGVLACVEPRDYPSDPTLIVIDDTQGFGYPAM
jgi:hypothetical protein